MIEHAAYQQSELTITFALPEWISTVADKGSLEVALWAIVEEDSATLQYDLHDDSPDIYFVFEMDERDDFDHAGTIEALEAGLNKVLEQFAPR